jgi:hypothetical protein
MDPIALAALKEVAPVLAVLVCGAIPVAIIWLTKHHQFRMKELEVEGQRSASSQQLAAIESRLSAIESALGVPAPRSPAENRAALLTGPATSADPAAAAPAATRVR